MLASFKGHKEIVEILHRIPNIYINAKTKVCMIG